MAWLRGALGASAVVMAVQIYSSCFVQAWRGLVLCVMLLFVLSKDGDDYRITV
jgi:hypothetical protein